MTTRLERKVWRELRKRKGRDDTGWFLAEGPRLLQEIVTSNAQVEVILAEPSAFEPGAELEWLERARASGSRVEKVERRVIEEIADTRNPQSIVTVAHIPRWTWDDIPPGLVLVLDGVQDPGNAGTLIRTAIGLGAAGIVALDGTADPWGPKAVRATAGAGLRRPTFRADSASAVDEFTRRKLPIWVASADGEPIVRGAEGPGRLALVVGSETRGVSPPLESAAARRVAIPMKADVESLNVGVAGAILLDRIMNG